MAIERSSAQIRWNSLITGGKIVALNWKSVTAIHVNQACAQILRVAPKNKNRGIVVLYGGFSLPAKDVLRVAYRIAHQLPEDAIVNFSSGDASISLLKALGFEVERIDPSRDAR